MGVSKRRDDPLILTLMAHPSPENYSEIARKLDVESGPTCFACPVCLQSPSTAINGRDQWKNGPAVDEEAAVFFGITQFE
jgi:hypothetical protein